MFCLRSWIPLLIFLTNCSPLYVLLFLTGNYVLTRPCVYCSILLFVLVFSLFDFKADWFEPRWSSSFTAAITETGASFLSGNTTLSQALLETAGIAVSAINGTGGSLASAAMDTVKRRMEGESASAAATSIPNAVNGFEWLRGILEKRSFRIPCVDVIVRL